MKCGLKETELCTFCKNDRETILHLFSDCIHVQSFWTTIRHFLEIKCSITLDPEPFLNILGIQDLQNNLFYELNFLLLISRYFIYMCKLRETTPTVDAFFTFIRYYRKIEEYGLYSYNQRRQQQIKNKWLFIEKMYL